MTRKRGRGRLRGRRDRARRIDFGGSRVTFACQGGEVFDRVTWRVEMEASRVRSLRLLGFLDMFWSLLEWRNSFMSLHALSAKRLDQCRAASSPAREIDGPAVWVSRWDPASARAAWCALRC